MNQLESCRTLRATIATARRNVAGGACIDLQGFDGEVAALCAAVPHAPPAERASIAAELNALLTALDALAATLVAQTDGARPGTASRRAAQAYVPARRDATPDAPPTADSATKDPG
jgi:hypothetical protein